MKNIFKIIPILLFVLAFSCDESDSRFSGEDPTSGWVEFSTSATTTGQTAESVVIPVIVNVPVYQNGLNVNYTLEAVEGDFTQFVVNPTNGSAFAAPDDIFRNLSIDLELQNMEIGRDFVTSFDVVLTSVSNGVNVGVDDSSIVRHRVTIPCSNPSVLPDDYFVGSYTVADVAATIGPGNGTENVASGTYTVSLVPGSPNSRRFDAAVLPAFVPTPKPFILTFTEDNVISLGDVASGIGCGGGGGAQYIYTDGGSNNTPWDICNDLSVLINYTEDPLGSCGGPFPASFSMVKN